MLILLRRFAVRPAPRLVLFWQGRLRPSLHPARLPRVLPLLPGTPQILMLSRWPEAAASCPWPKRVEP